MKKENDIALLYSSWIIGWLIMVAWTEAVEWKEWFANVNRPTPVKGENDE